MNKTIALCFSFAPIAGLFCFYFRCPCTYLSRFDIKIQFLFVVYLFLPIYRTLNNNNITTLPREIFSGMPRIRALRLSDNPFTCDCHLSWLSRYLRNSPRLAPYTRCHSPSQLKGQSLAELHEHDFKCSGKSQTQRHTHLLIPSLNSMVHKTLLTLSKMPRVNIYVSCTSYSTSTCCVCIEV